VGIKHNEKVDLLAKETAIGGMWNNNLTIREIITSLKLNYENIDKQVLLNKFNKLIGGYYLNNFKEIKFKFLRKIITNKKDCESLNRLVTGYSYTRSLYKMRLVD